ESAVLESYQPKKAKAIADLEQAPALFTPEPAATVFTVDHHPILAAGPLRSVFEEFRKQVKALDPCVTEEFHRRYVASMDETNCVDVEPLASKMRLTLNMKFHEINDPKGLCRDASGLGKWGHGDVQVDLASVNELPYVMGLVRQSFEKQKGSGAEA